MGLGASMGMMSVRALKCLWSQGLVVHTRKQGMFAPFL
mgnify:FL=1